MVLARHVMLTAALREMEKNVDQMLVEQELLCLRTEHATNAQDTSGLQLTERDVYLTHVESCRPFKKMEHAKTVRRIRDNKVMVLDVVRIHVVRDSDY